MEIIFRIFDNFLMEITFNESEYPGQVNVKIDEEHTELVKQLRARKVKLGPILRPKIQELIKKAIQEVTAMEMEKAG